MELFSKQRFERNTSETEMHPKLTWYMYIYESCCSHAFLYLDFGLWHILFHSLGHFRAWKKRLSPSRRKADETCCVNVCLGVFSSISSQALRGLLQFLTSKESHLPKLLPTAVNSLHFFLLFLQETEKLA